MPVFTPKSGVNDTLLPRKNSNNNISYNNVQINNNNSYYNSPIHKISMDIINQNIDMDNI